MNAKKVEMIIKTFLLSLICCQIIASASELPKVAPIQDDQKIVFASIGTPLSIRCPIDLQNSKEIYVDWTKEGDSLYLVDGYTMNDKGVLRIKNITERNKGQYTCSAINGHGSVSVSFLLIIVDRRTGDVEKNLNRSAMYSKTSTNGHEIIPSIKKSQMKVFQEETGDSLSLTCSATGYPAPHIFWLKDGKLIHSLEIENKSTRRQTHSVIILKKLLSSDAGVYRCIAKNSAGEDHMDYTLQVFEPMLPPEILSLKPKNLTVFYGHTVSFRCEGRNIPSLKLHVKWMKIIPEEEAGKWNRTFRLASNNYRVLDTRQDPFVTKSGLFHTELLIPNVTRSDSGTYVCLTVNDKGYKYRNASLKVIKPGVLMSFTPREPTASVSFLVFIVLSTAVVLTPLIFVIFLYCKCQQPRNPGNVTIENHNFTITDRTFNAQINVED